MLKEAITTGTNELCSRRRAEADPPCHRECVRPWSPGLEIARSHRGHIRLGQKLREAKKGRRWDSTDVHRPCGDATDDLQTVLPEHDLAR